MRKHHLEHPRNDKSLIWPTGGDANIKTHFACRVKAVTDLYGSKFSPLPAALLMLEGDPPVVHCWQFECTVTCSQAAAALQCRDSTGSRVGERKACQRFGALLARQWAPSPQLRLTWQVWLNWHNWYSFPVSEIWISILYQYQTSLVLVSPH